MSLGSRRKQNGSSINEVNVSKCEFPKLSIPQNIHFPNCESVTESQCVLVVKDPEMTSSKGTLNSFNPNLILFALGMHFSWDIYSLIPGNVWEMLHSEIDV